MDSTHVTTVSFREGALAVFLIGQVVELIHVDVSNDGFFAVDQVVAVQL